jgi:hypothetical protein
VHESGHCCVGRRHGLRILAASIASDGRSGKVDWANDARSVADAVVVLLAGRAASVRYDPVGNDGGCHDWEAARDLATRAWGSVGYIHLEQLQARAKTEVEQSWSQIERVAYALFHLGELDEAGIERMLACPLADLLALGRIPTAQTARPGPAASAGPGNLYRGRNGI